MSRFDHLREFIVRRLSSILASFAVAATGLTLATPVASATAAPGKATVRNAAIVAPSAVPNPQILRIVRLNLSNSFMVLGIDSVTAGANMHIWRMKDDLTIDTSFAPVNLGDEFEYPTVSNSTCMAQQSNSNCFNLENFAVNETAGHYAVSFRRELSVTVGQTPRSATLTSLAIGNLRTGALTAKKIFAFNDSPSYNPATDFAAYNPTVLATPMCNAAFGTTYQGVALSSAFISGWSLVLRPDASIMLGLTCYYSVLLNGNRTDYDTRGQLVLKPSGNNIVQDTSFGTGGFVKLFDDHTRCAQVWDTNSSDSSVTTMNSQKIYTVANLMYYPRVTTWPHGGNSVTTYNGCQTSGMTTYSSSALVARKIDGSVLATTNFNTPLSPGGRWLIDTAGRWNNLVGSTNSNTPTWSLFRMNTKGEPDTTLGANGLKNLTNMPANVTVNGTSVPMRYNLVGLAATSNGFMFTGFSEAGRPMSIMCNQPTTFESSNYPYYLDSNNGLVATFGTNGLGEANSYTDIASCGNNAGAPRSSFINAKGQHAQVVVLRASGSQTAGIRYTVWEAASGVTAGGDGAGVVGGSSAGAGRVDTRVYSTSLPRATQPDSAIQVLTARQAQDLDIRTSTPRICIALTTSVLMVNPGRCTVRIIDEDTRRVIRTMTTTVRAAEVEEGTTLTTDEPIMFRQASTSLSRTARAQVAELAGAATNAGRVVVIGHSAALGDVSPYSFAISRDRALAVRNALLRAGVKAPIEIVALSYSQPERTAKTEAAQAKNRRVEVFIFPK